MNNPYIGEVRTHLGVEYTWNGQSWAYRIHQFPKSVVTMATWHGTIPAPTVEEPTAVPDVENEYDWHILAGLATGRLYANELRVTS